MHLLGETFSLFTSLKLLLLASLEPSFDHFNLPQSTVHLSLRYFNTLESLLMRLGELDKPVSYLFEETVRHPELLIQVVVAKLSLGAAILRW